MDKKRILIVYANAGAGHRKAALAIEGAFREMGRPDIEVRVIDSIDYGSPYLKAMYARIYMFMITHIPTLWGLCYYLFDTRLVYRCGVGLARRMNNARHCKAFEKFILDHRPDAVVNAHFLGSEVVSSMRRRGLLKGTASVSVVTDYMMHSFWVDKDIDLFCVAQDASRDHLMKRGIPPEKIAVTGIPVHPVFSESKDKDELRRRLGIPKKSFTVLLTSGGFGVGPLRELVEALGREESGMQLIVVCGKNPALYKEINGMKGGCRIPVTVYEFVDNMDELMELADVIVAKSGGLTSSEALAKELPFIIISAIPGQEARNSRYLLRCGAAIQAKSVGKVGEVLKRLASSPEELARLKEKVRAVRKPRSAHDVAERVLKILG